LAENRDNFLRHYALGLKVFHTLLLLKIEFYAIKGLMFINVDGKRVFCCGMSRCVRRQKPYLLSTLFRKFPLMLMTFPSDWLQWIKNCWRCEWQLQLSAENRGCS